MRLRTLYHVCDAGGSGAEGAMSAGMPAHAECGEAVVGYRTTKMGSGEGGVTPEWVDQIITLITPILPKNFIGQIEINCVQGAVGNVNLKQSFKKEKSK